VAMMSSIPQIADSAIDLDERRTTWVQFRTTHSLRADHEGIRTSLENRKIPIVNEIGFQRKDARLALE